MVNGAGRTSNSPQFYADMAEGRNYGQRDIRDVKEGVDYLIAQGIADPDGVGVTGCSYGGYFTLQSLVEFPDVYKAGNTQCSLNDILYEYNFGWAYFMGYLMGRSPIQDPAEYVNDSPLYRASQVKSPLLVFQVFNDLGIELLEEFIGFSQYLFNVFLFEGVFHEIAFLPYSRPSLHCL